MINSKLSLFNSGTNTWTDVALSNEIPVSTNYAVADVREPDKRNSAWSKTISIPGTQEINLFFELLFEVNIGLQSFDPNLKTKARYYVNNKLNFIGNLQVLDMDVKLDAIGQPVQVTYNCSIIGLTNDLFIAFGDKYLTDLDFTGGFNIDHAFTIGANTINQPAVLGEGYCYPWVKYGIPGDSDSSWTFENLKPWIFERFYLRKMFFDAGKTWTSNFLDSAYYKRIITSPGIEGNLQRSQSVQNNAAFYAGKTGDTTTSISGSYFGGGIAAWIYGSAYNNFASGVFDNDSTGGFFDTGANYDTGTGIFTSGLLGYYQLGTTIDFEVKIIPPAGAVYYTITSLNGNFPFRVDISGTGASSSGTVTPNISTYTAFTITVTNPSFNMGVGSTAIIQLLQGVDLFQVAFQDVSFAPIIVGTSSISIKQKASSTYYALLSVGDLQYGEAVVMNDTIPKLIKQRDFFMGIIQSENLYVMQDPNNENNYIIEPREDFIQFASPLNWTNKFDIIKGRKVIPMGDLDFKRIIYSYKSDKDWLNQLYETNWKQTYGSNVLDITNDFIKGEKKFEVLFSATPVSDNPFNDLVYAKIYQANPDGTNIKTMTPNIRRMYWKGATACQQFTRYTQGAPYIDTSYNFAGMMDDPYAPTVTLDWGVPSELYYIFPGQTYSNNGLFNRAYSKMIQEITDKDSKIIRVWVTLDEEDMRTFSFRKIVRIEQTLYFVNKIMDYNPNAKQSTQVELLKLKAGISFSPIEYVVFLPGNGIGGGNFQVGGNGNGIIGGVGNINLGEGGVIIGGQNNYVGNG